MHQFLDTVPFDLYQLALFQLVATHQSFTRAAEVAGLTQSAVTRQVQAMETRLDISLLERTTRRVRLTPAGTYLLGEAVRLLGDVDRSLTRLAQEFGGARKEVRVAVSRSIGLAYLPGFFHANLRRHPEVACRMNCQSTADILTALEANEMDLGVFCAPSKLPKSLRITHRFEDVFALVVPSEWTADLEGRATPNRRREWLLQRPWLLLEESSQTGRRLRSWMRRQGWGVDPCMQLDNFDLIINLVALGMGASWVPVRALALYNQRSKLQRVPIPRPFTRPLVVVVRRGRNLPGHVGEFVRHILF